MKKNLKKFNTFIVIDIETTGFYPDTDRIIEISAIKVENNIPVDYFSELINPCCKIPSKIIDITNIDNEMVKDKRIIEEVIIDLIEFISNYPLVGHNLEFDLSFLSKYIEFHNEHSYSDTYLVARNTIKVESYKLESLCREFKIDRIPSHRSLDDCASTLLLYDRLYKYIESNDIKIKKRNFSENSLDIDSFAANIDVDANSYFYNKNVCVTCEFESLKKEGVYQKIVNLGGDITKKCYFEY